jgi:CheY-like chemotaxis protein
MKMSQKILVVEDDEDSRILLLCQLRFMKYEAIEAETSAQAIEKTLAEKPNLIIMDLAMPGVSGIETAKTLKQNPATAHIPVVAYTAWEHMSWRESALQAGVVEYLVKPVGPEVLKSTIEKYAGPGID